HRSDNPVPGPTVLPRLSAWAINVPLTTLAQLTPRTTQDTIGRDAQNANSVSGNRGHRSGRAWQESHDNSNDSFCDGFPGFFRERMEQRGASVNCRDGLAKN